MDILQIKDELENIARKLQLIEDKNADFIHNKKWKELKMRQDDYYIQLAKKELEFYMDYNDSSPNQFKQDKIDFYTKYIKNNLNKDKENENETNETKLL